VALTNFAIMPLRLMVPLPALSVVLSLERAVLVASRRTTSITWASSVEIVTIAGMLWIGIHVFDAVGVMMAAVALVSGRVLSTLWLVRPSWHATAPARAGRDAHEDGE
jgi:O-antigen/teichoic acid export membrane protein